MGRPEEPGCRLRSTRHLSESQTLPGHAPSPIPGVITPQVPKFVGGTVFQASVGEMSQVDADRSRQRRPERRHMSGRKWSAAEEEELAPTGPALLAEASAPPRRPRPPEGPRRPEPRGGAKKEVWEPKEAEERKLKKA